MSRTANIAAIIVLGVAVYATRFAASAGVIAMLVLLTILIDAAV